MPIEHDFSLDAKYRQEEGTIFLSGIQALVRLPLDQHRADRGRGLNTATLISGYRGSPLGGFDLTLERNPPLLREHDVVFISGVNEDLGATAVFGSQLANLFPQPKYDGVLGMWYGKGPGVDRSGDIFKHANFAGVGRHGGVLALGGDDPLSKSSTLPTHSEVAFYDALFPVLFPGNVQEMLDLGRLGFELSRYSGLLGRLQDRHQRRRRDRHRRGGTRPRRDRPIPASRYDGQPWRHTQNPMLLPPFGLETEREIYYGRLEAAKAFAAANGLNRITRPHARRLARHRRRPARRTTTCARRSRELGLDDAALRALRHPPAPGRHALPAGAGDRARVRARARGDPRRRGEARVRRAVHARRPLQRARAPARRRQARRAGPAAGARRRRARRRPHRPDRGQRGWSSGSRSSRSRRGWRCWRRCASGPAPLDAGPPAVLLLGLPAQPLDGGARGLDGRGRHRLPRHGAHHGARARLALTHMGGEGAQWVGMAPFTETPHMFQNLGDGTFFHSGSLAIRQAIAAGTNITYKILYNSAVAMTGGQDAAGAMPVPELTRMLEAEGVRRIIVITDEPDKYPGATRAGRRASRSGTATGSTRRSACCATSRA